MDAGGQVVEIDEGEEVDGLEFAIDAGGAAKAGGDFEVGAEKARSARRFDRGFTWATAASGLGQSAERRIDQIFFAQGFVEGHAFALVLRPDGAAADQIARFAAHSVKRDAFPEHVQDRGIAVVLMNAGAAEFEDFPAERFVRGKIKNLFAVVAQVAFGAVAGLHAVGADEFVRDGVVNHQVIADEIEFVAVESPAVGGGESFPEFTIEDQITQALAFDDIFHGKGHAHTKLAGGSERVAADVLQDGGGGHVRVSNGRDYGNVAEM